jgi:hypothetical protein
LPIVANKDSDPYSEDKGKWREDPEFEMGSIPAEQGSQFQCNRHAVLKE